MPGGKRIPLLKTLLTSACERDCYYCSFRAGRDFRRTTFKPEEMAKTFLGLYQAGIAQGLFLSSGVAGGGMRTQDQMIARLKSCGTSWVLPATCTSKSCREPSGTR